MLTLAINAMVMPVHAAETICKCTAGCVVLLLVASVLRRWTQVLAREEQARAVCSRCNVVHQAPVACRCIAGSQSTTPMLTAALPRVMLSAGCHRQRWLSQTAARRLGPGHAAIVSAAFVLHAGGMVALMIEGLQRQMSCTVIRQQVRSQSSKFLVPVVSWLQR